MKKKITFIEIVIGAIMLTVAGSLFIGVPYMFIEKQKRADCLENATSQFELQKCDLKYPVQNVYVE